MADLENVIRELEKEVAEGSVPCKPKGYMFPFKLIQDALSLLKAQEPRVMTLEEASSRLGEPVWVEEKAPDAVYCEVLFDVDGKAFKLTSGNIEFGGLLTGHSLFSVEPYGRDFRFWTSRPTDEQRENVKWDG